MVVRNSERYGDDRATLTEQFIWMQLCLARTQTLELTEKIHIQERLSMFDQLWEENPTIQKMREEYLQAYSVLYLARFALAG